MFCANANELSLKYRFDRKYLMLCPHKRDVDGCTAQTEYVIYSTLWYGNK